MNRFCLLKLHREPLCTPAFGIGQARGFCTRTNHLYGNKVRKFLVFTSVFYILDVIFRSQTGDDDLVKSRGKGHPLAFEGAVQL